MRMRSISALAPASSRPTKKFSVVTNASAPASSRPTKKFSVVTNASA